ncbi:hypothetical protein T4E_426 [Trichinella pseudospiralis]|uniref:Uncharacterized protein n=1 Tax=Trichinella pseudospiralis TaxID=6337 RepID=A0A0V0YJQ8_TRIPS|nr:hypothetical protein T4E_426 [Trichinella pseudospiralis]
MFVNRNAGNDLKSEDAGADDQNIEIPSSSEALIRVLNPHQRTPSLIRVVQSMPPPFKKK